MLEPPRARLARVEDLHIPGGDRSPRPAGVDAASNVILPVPLHFTHRGRVMSEAAHAQPSAAEASALAWSTDEKG